MCIFLDGVMRSKRRCVLEKKQPYSGDEWCSGPDTEEDEDKPHTMTQRESYYIRGGNTLLVAVLLMDTVRNGHAAPAMAQLYFFWKQ